MYDAFSRVAERSNKDTACMGQAEFDEIKVIISGLNKRFDAIEALSGIASCCVSDAIAGVICQDPSLVNPGGACHPNRKMAACLRDAEIILRYVCYALMAGDVSVLEERCLKGLKETYQALNVSIPGMIQAISLMKVICVAHIQSFNNTGRRPSAAQKKTVTPGDCCDLASECAIYFDRVIAALS
jgi:phycoerythrin beta chain